MLGVNKNGKNVENGFCNVGILKRLKSETNLNIIG